MPIKRGFGSGSFRNLLKNPCATFVACLCCDWFAADDRDDRGCRARYSVRHQVFSERLDVDESKRPAPISQRPLPGQAHPNHAACVRSARHANPFGLARFTSNEPWGFGFLEKQPTSKKYSARMSREVIKTKIPMRIFVF